MSRDLGDFGNLPIRVICVHQW